MIQLTNGPPLFVELGLALFCLLDVALSVEAAVRWLPRWGWALAVLAFPVCGCVMWLVSGRPWRALQRPEGGPGPSGRARRAGRAEITGKDPLLGELWAVHEEHERTLRAWEADLRRREARLRTAHRRR